MKTGSRMGCSHGKQEAGREAALLGYIWKETKGWEINGGGLSRRRKPLHTGWPGTAGGKMAGAQMEAREQS